MFFFKVLFILVKCVIAQLIAGSNDLMINLLEPFHTFAPKHPTSLSVIHIET